MRVIAIGDIHGKTQWESIYEREKHNFDNLVFIGDYFDCFEKISAQDQIVNFNKIVTLKKQDSRVEILIGNHDLHYLIDQQYSGYQYNNAIYIRIAIKQSIDWVQPSIMIDDVLYTHAGVTMSWAKNNNLKLNNRIDAQINDLFKYNHNAFGFQYKGRFTNPYGDDPDQGCMWVRPNSLIFDKADYHQIVGHTTYDSIKINAYNKLCLIDTNLKEYLEVIDGKYFNPVKL